MKRFFPWMILAALVLVCLWALPAQAASDSLSIPATYDGNGLSEIVDQGTCGDNLTWVLDSADVLTISGTGEMENYDGSFDVFAPWFGCQTRITSVKISDGVTGIGNYAFSDCYSLTSVELPESLTRIGSNAFSFCMDLTSIELPAGVTSIGEEAFHGCRSLANIEIPSGVTSIGNRTFNACISLTSIELPAGVTSIGEEAFFWCNSLTSIELPASVTSIAECTFYGCSSLTSIQIPAGVTSIGREAFQSCSSLKRFFFLGDLPAVENNAFYEVSAFVFYPDGNKTYQNVLSTLGGGNLHWFPDSNISGILDQGKCGDDLTWALDGTGALTISGMGAMEDYAYARYAPWYKYRAEITSVKISNGVTSIGDEAFSGCSGLTSIEIPAGVTGIGNYAFSDCYSLTSINIPEGMTSIGDDAFWGCSNLASINIPTSVTEIGEWVFCNCSSLTSIQIPASVTSIGGSAFWGCSSLTSVTFAGNAPTLVGWSIFGGINATVYYPAGDDTWTSDLMWGHDGQLTWVPYYNVLEGENSVWETDSGENVTVQIDAPNAKVESISVDGQTVDPANYSVSGDTVVTFPADYLGTLVSGEHSVTVYFADGAVASTTLTVIQAFGPGDIDGNGIVDNKDVEYLLWHTLFPDSYPVENNADCNGDGEVNNLDVEYLLWYTLFPDSYPLNALITSEKKEI